MSKKDYQITDDLLDLLCELYLQTSASFHEHQRQLLQENPDQIKHNLAVAHGVGECLRTIIKHLPQKEERMYGRDLRRTVWLTLNGTECGRDQSRERSKETTGPSRSTGSGKKSIL